MDGQNNNDREDKGDRQKFNGVFKKGEKLGGLC
jgi:hypothetical protein